MSRSLTSYPPGQAAEACWRQAASSMWQRISHQSSSPSGPRIGIRELDAFSTHPHKAARTTAAAPSVSIRLLAMGHPAVPGRAQPTPGAQVGSAEPDPDSRDADPGREQALAEAYGHAPASGAQRTASPLTRSRIAAEPCSSAARSETRPETGRDHGPCQPARKPGIVNDMAKDNDVDNEGHAKFERWVSDGTAVVVSDENLPGGRFQLAGCCVGGEIILTDWRQDAAGDWHARHCTLIKRGCLPKLAELLRKTGYHLMPVP